MPNSSLALVGKAAPGQERRMRNRLVHLCLATLLALFAAAVQIGLLAASAPAAPATIFNYPSVSAPCNTTLQACVSAASHAGDVVNVAAGTYITGQLVISHAITLQGAGPGTAGSSTILRPDGSHGVISVTSGLAAGVVISGLTIMSGTSVAGGGGLFADAGTPLTMLNVDILSNTISGPTSGGGVLALGAVTLTNVNFVNNRALNGAGGGLRAASTAIITGGRFERNSSTNGGGALRVNSALTMIDVTVISNTNTAAGQDGGGVNALGGLVMVGGLVQANTTNNNGGGLAVTTAAASISGTQIISNTGNEGGGVVASSGLNITNTLLDKNVARTGGGGAIFGNGSFTVTLAGTSNLSLTTISNSSAITHGAGLYALGNVLLIGEVHFSANHSTAGDGGALYAQDVTDNAGNSVLLEVHFIGNTASGNGGAVRALGQVRLLNSPLFQNNAAANGGAVYANGSVFLSRGTSSGNSAVNGGAVYGLSSVLFNVHDTLNNTASGQGGCAFSATQITYNSANAIGCSAGTSGGAAFATQTVTLSAN